VYGSILHGHIGVITSRNEVLGHQATVPKLGANKGLWHQAGTKGLVGTKFWHCSVVLQDHHSTSVFKKYFQKKKLRVNFFKTEITSSQRAKRSFVVVLKQV
jgi:hypothetical protein